MTRKHKHTFSQLFTETKQFDAIRCADAIHYFFDPQ